MNNLKGYIPPCSRDISVYSPDWGKRIHSDPLFRNFLTQINEDIPPYSALSAPYRWMREESFRDICESENLNIRGPENIEKTSGWVYEPDRQKQLLDHFWSKIKEGEGKSLIFYYVNQGNPIDESLMRLIVGIGRIKKVGPQLFFGGTDKSGQQYPIWTRTVTQDFPAQGIRLPYQEYLEIGKDPKTISCSVPKAHLLRFSYVAEHVTDDIAISILDRFIQSVQRVKEDGFISGDWDRHLGWLNDRLDELWINRGPYPGIGSVLQYLGFPQGAIFQKTIILDCIRNNKNPLEYILSILDGNIQPPQQYIEAFKHAKISWRAFGKKPVRQELLKLLTKFELTTEQIKRISDPEERISSGIIADETDLISNPYIISELDLGSSISQPILIDTIDHGMVPEGNSALFIPKNEFLQKEDERRIRGVGVAALNLAAENGDTVCSIDELLSSIRAYFPENRSCRPDPDLFYSNLDFYRERLWLDENIQPPLVALGHLRILEKGIADTLKARLKRQDHNLNEKIDWKSALHAEFGQPRTERERLVQLDEVNALQILYSKRVSILTGSAGTGKTSVIKVFLNEIEKVKGKEGVILLAPTGKARVRLSTSTKRKAYTIHQFLHKYKWFIPDIFVLKREGGDQTYAPTIIIDECSMVPVDLLGTLFKAIKMDLVTRLIFVGDPNQLPPIGPGRPFVDVIAWLQLNYPDCIAMLNTSMRVSDEDKNLSGESTALSFAESYRSSTVNPGDDELLSLVAQQKVSGDIEVHFWNNPEQLTGILYERLEALVGVIPNDYLSFNKSLGIENNPRLQENWKDAEKWQILSPIHAHAYGTEVMNREIQRKFKIGLINQAQNAWSKYPKPFGDQQIVYTDKVIQTINQKIIAWPRDVGALNYVANGEIGIVTTASKNDIGDYLQVGYSTQEKVTYRYSRKIVEENLELAYALTVHKSQGSDFDYVFLIIPYENPILSRELIYTGLTRFRKKLILLIQNDISTLRDLRKPERSDTYKRNTFLFNISIRPQESGRLYPETLIHRTSTGIAVRSKSEVIVADIFTRLGLTYLYEEPLVNPHNTVDFRLPDFTIGFQGDIYFWEHLGMLNLPTYFESWMKKKRWYEDVLGIPVLTEEELQTQKIQPGESPIVITSRDGEDGSIDAQTIEQRVRKFILLE